MQDNDEETADLSKEEFQISTPTLSDIETTTTEDWRQRIETIRSVLTRTKMNRRCGYAGVVVGQAKNPGPGNISKEAARVEIQSICRLIHEAGTRLEEATHRLHTLEATLESESAQSRKNRDQEFGDEIEELRTRKGMNKLDDENAVPSDLAKDKTAQATWTKKIQSQASWTKKLTRSH